MTSPLVAVNQWEAENRRNPYPFVDTATLRDSSGIVTISPSWVLDAKFWPSMASASRVYLKEINRTKDMLTITIASLDEDLCTTETTDFTKRRLAFYNANSQQVGFMSFAEGGLVSLHDIPTGVYRFASDASEFVASALAVEVLTGLNSIKGQTGDALREDFRIVGGEGVMLIKGSGNKIRVDIIGDPYYRRDVCDDRDFLGRVINPVRLIIWTDKKALRSGGVRPVDGSINTTAVGMGTVHERGHVSPGQQGNIVERIE
jgi:hypothetical protein